MSARAPPQAPSPTRVFRRTVDRVGDTWGFRECAGRGDDTRCPYGADAGPDGVRCDDCREYYEQDPGRLVMEDATLTRPTGDPRETGHGTAA